MAKYLFLFTIGPVQSFIAQARKTKDLQAGSAILSELIDKAIKIFEKKAGSVIFPNPDNEAKPNRFLGKIETSKENLPEIGKSIENEVKNAFKKMAKNALNEIKIEPLIDFDKQTECLIDFDKQTERPIDFDKQTERLIDFDKQVDNHLEIFWIFEEIKGDNVNDYQTAYKNIERNLGGIKNIKSFVQLAERGRKCSVDGEKNALFYKKTKKGKEPNHLNHHAIEVKEDIDNPSFQEGEALSAISLIKRFYSKEAFPSTAEIALMDAIHKIENNEKLNSEYQEYKKLFGKDWEERFMYEENLTKKELNEEHNKILSKYKSFVRELKDNDIHLNKYYALLVFDGDNMGKILSGEFLKNKNINFEEYQKYLSELLGKYAKHAKNHINSNKSFGYTIYAGGDDYMGFLNLEHLFEVLKTLRDDFDTQVNKQLKEKYPLTDDFTFSAGIAIAHYKAPLGVTLKKAKAMEDKAKDAGRDALGITILKHSGEQHETVLKWDNLKNFCNIIEVLENNTFSANWINNIQREFILLQDRGAISLEINPILEHELKRFIGRNYMKENEDKDKAVKNLFDNVKNILKTQDFKFKQTSEALNICKFFNRKEL